MSIGMLESGMMPIQMLFSAAFYGCLTWLGFRPEKGKSGGSAEKGKLTTKETIGEKIEATE